jgi:predicted RNA methylase
MASLTKNYTDKKLLGQVYTPHHIVKKILDNVDYQGFNILGKTIIDPACGDGQFLIEVVRRIIQVSPKLDLKKNLACVYGWDVDAQAIEKCKENLNQLLDNQRITIDWNIQKFDWQIAPQNAIRKIKRDLFYNPDPQEFDFVVGNPPYIRIQHLELADRKYIQQYYDFCKSGSTDMYIAFFELCLDLLRKTGICGLITPNTFLYTETAKAMRNYFAPNYKVKQITLLKQITNYGTIQLFDNATTYSAITIFSKQSNESFIYEQVVDNQSIKLRHIRAGEIAGKPIWQLSTQENIHLKGKRLGEICSIHVGITTLADKAFIFSKKDKYLNISILFSKLTQKEEKIESALLKPIIKGSTFKKGDSIKEYVLFPYQKDKNGKYQIIPEKELKEKYPLAYQYLKSIKTELDKRDNGNPNPVAWYAFGRNQSLDTGFGKKIIFSPMNKEPNFIFSDNEEATIYSGYFIKYQGDTSKIERLLAQLNSLRMKDFVAISSRDFRGGYKAYNKKIIENFIVDMDELAG